MFGKGVEQMKGLTLPLTATLYFPPLLADQSVIGTGKNFDKDYG